MCELLRTEIAYLHHKIAAGGIYPDPEVLIL